MDLYGNLQLKWSVGYDGSPIHFIDNSTMVYASGNGLCLTHCSGRHVKSLPSHGSGVGSIATAPQASTIAYAESTLNPKVFAISYPSCQLIATFKDGAKLEYVSLAISGNGKRLATLSGVPDFLLILWDVQEGCELCRTDVGPGGSWLSLNPLNWKQMCVVGAEKLTLYLLEQCDNDQLLLTAQETTLPDRTTTVGTTLQPPQPSLSSTKTQSKMDEIHTTSDQPRLPELSNVLYKETYDEYTRVRNPVVLVSHCWSSHQTLFIGCRGGQLLKVDFDSGVIEVLANTQLTQTSIHTSSNQDTSQTTLQSATSTEQQTEGGEDQKEGLCTEGDGSPNTAHAVLDEGSLECLTISRRGLFAAGKNGKIYCLAISSELQVLESHTLPSRSSISCLSWSPDYSQMAIGTQQATIHIADPLQLSACSLVSAHGYSPIVGLDVLSPGSENIVTCRSDGTVQVWGIADAALVSSYNLKEEVCCVSCPLSCPVAVIGCRSGHVCVVGLTELTSPALLAQTRLYYSQVTTIRSDQKGKFLAAMSSEDGSIFLCSSLMSTGFTVLGHTGIKGKLLDLSLVSLEPGSEGNTLIAVLSQRDGKHFITLFQLPNSIIENPPSDLYLGDAKEFSSEFILKQEAVLTEPASTVMLSSQATMFASLSNSPDIAKFTLPPLKEKAMEWNLSPDVTLSAHDMGGLQLKLSFHQKWIASAANDGKLIVRLVESPEKAVTCTPHHYQNNGCTSLALSTDCQHIVTVGDRGTITCWSWNFTNHGSLKAQAAKEYLDRVLRSLNSQQSHDKSVLESTTHIRDKVTPEEERTWLEVAEEEVQKTEDEKYSELKSGLRQEIGELREKLLEMINTNEQAPDMERLGREEFILDMEEHDRLEAEEKELIQQVREEIELSNLAKMFLREQIKRECWDSMKVKGKVIKGFQGSLEVSNYPMVSRSEEELKEVARVHTLRSIELADREVRCEATASLRSAAQPEEEEDVLDGGEGDTLSKEDNAEKEENTTALFGSHAPKYGGGCDLLYSQFELHSPVDKKHQLVLLQDCLYRIAETFNKEFEEVAQLKQAEIARIREKNVRILKIIHQLQLEEELVQPSLCPEELPEDMLTVQDTEVKVEKYLSPEEKMKHEEAMRLEEERRLAEMGDNPRERALDMMMGGRLEANVEDDLFKDLPRPDFMLKDPAERTEEEIRAALEFEKKEAAFLEEREKLKKALEGELRKLQSTISQAMETFDERLGKLFQLKINTEMAMHQEQLKMVGLVSALQVEEEVRGREKQLNTILRNKKAMKAQLGSMVNTIQRKIAECREQYDRMLAEDRTLDKDFKRDFSDCEPFVDQLYKLFKRRPRGQRLKHGASEGGLTLDPKSQNPFPHRLPSAVGGVQKSVSRGTEDGMSELDHVSHMPDGVESSQWDRLVAARRRKWDSEIKVKAVALQLADMEAFLKRRQVEEERVQTEVQDAFGELNKLSEDKTLFNLDLQVQLLLKQGQVEVDEGDFIPDYSGSVLVHRRVIEELNKEIKTHGEAKLDSMKECKDFKRGIRLLEWERTRLRMQVEDLRDQARDVQLLRVTKDLQLGLNEEGQRSRDQQDIETLEKTLEINDRVHKKRVREKKRQLAKLQSQKQKRREENKQLDHTLIEKQVSVLERQAAENLAGVAPSEAGARQRMADIVSRRRLVELARAQAAEIGVLRAELERLRMATFPALVQVD